MCKMPGPLVRVGAMKTGAIRAVIIVIIVMVMGRPIVGSIP